MPRKKNKRIYFDQDTEDGIIAYNAEENPAIKNTIYNEHIAYAFDKLAENIINTFKFTYFDVPFEDVKAEVVSFLVMNIHKFKADFGSKAFSYFSVVAKNYLILHNNNNYKKFKSHDSIDGLDYMIDHTYNDPGGSEISNFLVELTAYFEKKIPQIFKKQADIDIAFSVLELIRCRDDIENFNKKSLYILIREMTGVNTAKITNVINVMKKHYAIIFNEFHKTGTIEI